MQIQRLQVDGLRNLQSANLVLHSSINLFYGANGAGKSSLLEAVSLVFNGRSFRTHEARKLVCHGREECTVFVELVGSAGVVRVGLRRGGDGETELRLDQRMERQQSKVSALLPVMIIEPESFVLVDGGPQERRRFLDWGVFHVEHAFNEAHKNYARALKQRNHLLRSGKIGDAELMAFEQQMRLAAEHVHAARQRYIDRFNLVLRELQHTVGVFGKGLVLSYNPGWKGDLGGLLKESRLRDREVGHTRHGPHRADWVIRVESGLARDVLSRGQKKQLILLLKVCQLEVLKVLAGSKAAVLVDDISSELGADYQRVFVDLLLATKGQLFVTGLDKGDLDRLFFGLPHKMFHVEHGKINEADVASV